MPSPWQVECLLMRMQSLRNEILRVKNKDRPYPETNIVYDALVAVIDSRYKRVDNAMKLYSISGRTLPYRVFKTVAKDLESVFKFFSFADRVDSPRIPFEVIRSLSWVANYLFDEKCYTVVRLDPEYNYSILSCRREFDNYGWGKYWKESVTANVAQSEDWNEVNLPTVLLLGFPSPDAGSTLVHALAAHEFGHEFAYKYQDHLNKVHEQIVLEVKSHYNAVLQDYLEGLVMKLQGESRDDVYEKGRKYVVAILDNVAKNWLKEIFSDLVAARLVGPPFLAAFDRIILGHGQASEKYPPAYLRRSLVHEYLKAFLPDIIEDPVWLQLFDTDNGQHRSSDELFRIMEHVFESVIPKIENVLLEVPCPLTKIMLVERSALVERMEDHLDHLAPPSVPLELGDDLPDAEKFWLLMFAAWHYRLGERFNNLIESYGLEGGISRAEDILGNLILHAMQSLELRAKWTEKYYPNKEPHNVS